MLAANKCKESHTKKQTVAKNYCSYTAH